MVKRSHREGTRSRARTLVVGTLVGTLAVAACNTSSAVDTRPDERPIPSLRIRGTVVTATGGPATGVTVRSHGFQPDCTTPIVLDRDTLVTTDAAGAFQGFLRTLWNVSNACVTFTAEQNGQAVASQSLQVVFRGSLTGTDVDTATVRLQLP